MRTLSYLLLVVTLWCIANAKNVIYKLPADKNGNSIAVHKNYNLYIDKNTYLKKNFMIRNENGNIFNTDYDENLKNCYLNTNEPGIHCEVNVRSRGAFSKEKSYIRKIYIPLDSITEIPECEDCTIREVYVFVADIETEKQAYYASSTNYIGGLTNDQLIDCKSRSTYNLVDMDKGLPRTQSILILMSNEVEDYTLIFKNSQIVVIN